MTAITRSADIPTEATTPARLWPAGLGFALLAGAATSAVAAVAHAAGVSLEVGGEEIPLLGFANLTVILSVVGLGIATGIRRWSAAPRRTWVITASALTALSLVPDVLADASVATKVTLMTTHVVAAAIVVPALARRLAS